MSAWLQPTLCAEHSSFTCERKPEHLVEWLYKTDILQEPACIYKVLVFLLWCAEFVVMATALDPCPCRLTMRCSYSCQSSTPRSKRLTRRSPTSSLLCGISSRITASVMLRWNSMPWWRVTRAWDLSQKLCEHATKNKLNNWAKLVICVIKSFYM